METIAVVAPFPNPHFLDIFEAPAITTMFNIDRFCFRSLPSHRQGLGWEEASFTKLSSSYLKLPSSQKSVAGYSTVVYYGAIDPKCIPAAMMWSSLRRGQKVFLVSEGIRYQHPRWRSIAFSSFLNHDRLEILAIGHRSADDYRQAGLIKPTYRKYGFFENYGDPDQKVETEANTCRILSVGQLIDRKNFLSVIQSLQRIGNSIKQKVVYTICGEGEQRPLIESEVEKLPKHIEVRLLGNCDAKQLDLCFRSTDIFAMPSTYDGWGVVLNQAIHFRLPILVSSGVRSASDYLVRDGFNGFIFDSDWGLDNNLTSLISDYALRAKFEQNNTEVAKSWHIDAVSHNLVQILSGKEPNLISEFDPLGRI